MNKIFGILLKIVKIFVGVFIALFTIYQFNIDMKISAVAYKILNKYHDQKVTDVRF